MVNTQVNLAKNHQIYGFIIDYDTSHTNIFTNETMNIFLNKIQFPFFFYGEMMKFNIMIKQKTNVFLII